MSLTLEALCITEKLPLSDVPCDVPRLIKYNYLPPLLTLVLDLIFSNLLFLPVFFCMDLCRWGGAFLQIKTHNRASCYSLLTANSRTSVSLQSRSYKENQMLQNCPQKTQKPTAPHHSLCPIPFPSPPQPCLL